MRFAFDSVSAQTLHAQTTRVGTVAYKTSRGSCEIRAAIRRCRFSFARRYLVNFGTKT
jgi:hypothetical protein